MTQALVSAQVLAVPWGTDRPCCEAVFNLCVFGAVWLSSGCFALPQKRLKTAMAVGLHQERQQRGPFGWQPTVSPGGQLSAICRAVAAEGMLRVFATTRECQAPRTGQRCSSWASRSRVWLKAPEDQFTQAPGCFPTNGCTVCLVPTSYHAHNLDLKGKRWLCPSPRSRCLPLPVLYKVVPHILGTKTAEGQLAGEQL